MFMAAMLTLVTKPYMGNKRDVLQLAAEVLEQCDSCVNRDSHHAGVRITSSSLRGLRETRRFARGQFRL